MPNEEKFNWGVFHDGDIVSLKAAEGALFIHVEIDYLTKRMNSITTFFRIRANGFKKIQYEKYGGSKETDLDKLQGEDLEIQYSKIEGATRILECSEGVLSIEYSNEDLFDDQDNPLSPSQIYKVAQRYWDDFGQGKSNSD